MMKIVLALVLVLAVSSPFASAKGPQVGRRSTLGKRSICDGRNDGYTCGGTSNRLFYCFNGDVLWNWPCVTGKCFVNGSNPMCEFPQDAKFCKSKYTTSSRSGTYCDGDSTIVTCSQTGSQFTQGCATNAVPDATCEQFSNDWAMCDYPPKCEDFPSDDSSKLNFCTGPFSPENRRIPIPVAENVTLYDEKAAELSAQLGSVIYPKNVAVGCEYLIHSTACYVGFPDCPGHQDCLLVCGQMKNCATYYKNNTPVPDLDCESYCGQFAGASALSFSLVLIAAIVLISMVF